MLKIIKSIVVVAVIVALGYAKVNLVQACTWDCICHIGGTEVEGSCTNDNRSSCGPGKSCSCTGWGLDCGGSDCTSNNQCGSNQVCCKGFCVGTGQCGGGGGGGGACPSGTAVKCGSPKIVKCVNNQAGCIPPQIFTGWQTGDEVPNCQQSYPNTGPGKQFCQTNCGCCTSSQTYINGQGCVANCTVGAPTVPTNLFPANGSVTTNSNISLSWSPPSSWGKGCPSNTDTFDVYIGLGTTGDTVLYAANGIKSITSIPVDLGTQYGTYYWRVKAKNGSAVSYSTTTSFTYQAPPPAITTPWFQIKDGDVTANGSISSNVPTGAYFNLDGNGGFPGVPVFSTGLSYSPGLLSSKNWSANTSTTQGRIFDYTYFKNLIPDNILPTTDPSFIPTAGYVADGYEWFKINGNLTLNSVNFGSRKVILFIENGSLTINGNLNVTDGVGFFGAFVDGDINVKSTVTGAAALEGIYLSDGVFTSEVAATQLHVRGSVATFAGASLLRNLVDDSTASELFEYAPDQILLFPKKLAYRRTKWSEIAP